MSNSEMKSAAEDNKQASGSDEHVLADITDSLDDNIEGDSVTVGEIISKFEDRGIGALCTIIGLIASLPLIGAIPGMSIITGALLLLCAGQYVFGRTSPWVPGFLRERGISADKMNTATEKAKPYAEWIDQYIKPRWGFLVGGSLQRRVIAVCLCLLALTMFPLALVPWGVQAPAAAVVFFGVAIIGRDGVFAAIGYALTALTAGLIYYFSGAVSSAVAYLIGGG